MAWTAPKTWLPTEAPTAANLNIHLRDNLLETMTAKATQISSHFVTSTAHTIVERYMDSAVVATAQSTTSTSFVNLATVGPSVTATTGTTAMVFISCRMRQNTDSHDSYASWAISGATTRAALTDTAVQQDGVPANSNWRVGSVDLINTLNPGVNTFTMQYRADSTGASTATFSDRLIVVVPF